MTKVVAVRFPFSFTDLWFNPIDLDLSEKTYVICKTERGQEAGQVVGAPFEVDVAEPKEKTGRDWLSPVLRIATQDDLETIDALEEEAEAAFQVLRELVKKHELDMKPVGVNYLFDGKKAVCYFSAEERVDFRELVKDLAAALNKHIDMRQIGSREETALIGGYSPCGCEFCCTRWERQHNPISIRMAKDQDLPLNGTKISGACGRLMCCLRFEDEAYKDFKMRAPKRNAKIETPLGSAKITGYNTPRELIDLEFEDGRRVQIPLSCMHASKEARTKAEECNCPLRPDSVSLAALQSLESADIALALTELENRTNGFVVEEDVLVSETASTSQAQDAPRETQAQTRPKREKRRLRIRKNKQENKAQTQEEEKLQAVPTHTKRHVKKENSVSQKREDTGLNLTKKRRHKQKSFPEQKERLRSHIKRQGVSAEQTSASQTVQKTSRIHTRKQDAKDSKMDAQKRDVRPGRATRVVRRHRTK